MWRNTFSKSKYFKKILNLRIFLCVFFLFLFFIKLSMCQFKHMISNFEQSPHTSTCILCSTSPSCSWSVTTRPNTAHTFPPWGSSGNPGRPDQTCCPPAANAGDKRDIQCFTAWKLKHYIMWGVWLLYHLLLNKLNRMKCSCHCSLDRYQPIKAGLVCLFDVFSAC